MHTQTCDHAGGNVRLKELMKNENLPVYAHKMDNCHGATHFVEHSDVIRLGGRGVSGNCRVTRKDT